MQFSSVHGEKQDGVAEHNLGYRVVSELTQNLTSKNHDVFFHNFFSSVKVAEDLLKDGIYSCGTTTANRKDFPKELVATNREVKALRQGESIFRRKNNLLATAWKDKKIVHFLSTQSNPVGNDTENCKQRDGTVIRV